MLVVVHTPTEALLIKRADHDNFWQSVTGSLQWGESAPTAAVRELAEETGICDVSLRSTGIRRSYAILDAWRSRYQAGVTRNFESLFYCSLQQRCEVQLSPAEHSEFQWVPFAQAAQQVYSWTNRLAITNLS